MQPKTKRQNQENPPLAGRSAAMSFLHATQRSNGTFAEGDIPSEPRPLVVLVELLFLAWRPIGRPLGEKMLNPRSCMQDVAPIDPSPVSEKTFSANHAGCGNVHDQTEINGIHNRGRKVCQRLFCGKPEKYFRRLCPA
jgi:hypothetical protein